MEELEWTPDLMLEVGLGESDDFLKVREVWNGRVRLGHLVGNLSSQTEDWNLGHARAFNPSLWNRQTAYGTVSA